MPKSVGFTVIKEECLSWHLPDRPRSAFLTRADLVVFSVCTIPNGADLVVFYVYRS